MQNLLPGSFPADVVDFPSPFQFSGALPRGSWRMMANGRIYELDITDVQGTQVTATISSGQIQDAVWDSSANASTLAKLSFTRVLANVGLKQRFDAFLLHYSAKDPLWRLVGTYGVLGEEAKAGWYATLPR